MKILELMLSCSPGGTERFVVDLCNELSNSNKVVLYTLKDDNKANRKFYLSELSNRVVYKCANFGDGFNPKYLWDVYKIVKQEQPDVVHLHIAMKYCIVATLLLGRNIPFIETIHNDIKSNYMHWFNKLLYPIYGFLRVHNVVTISQTNYDNFCAAYHGIDNTLIYNGRAIQKSSDKFDSVKYEIARLKKDNETIVFLHVARCMPQKNQELLIESFNRYIQNGANAILIIIGAMFDEPLGIALKEIACESIFFIGTRNNIADYMRNADAFILSSNYEGMPITVIEALLNKLPVLSTPVCGVIDVIENKKNGLISKDFTSQAFYEMLCDFEHLKSLLKNNIEIQNEDSLLRIENCTKAYTLLFQKYVSEWNKP